ncbi:MAG: hypothetical protein P8Z35_05785 [Ignavibacteriaceae bacterium]
MIYFYRKIIKRKTGGKEPDKNQNYTLLKKLLHYSAFSHETITELFQPFLTEKGNEIYTKLKKVLRNYRNYLTENYITIENEIKIIIEFLEIEKIRKKKEFNYEIKTSDNLILNELQIPSMVLLPIIANMTRQTFSGGTTLKIELIRVLNNDLKVQMTNIFNSKIKKIGSDYRIEEVISNLKDMFTHLNKDENLYIKQFILGTPEDDHIGFCIEIIIPEKITRYIDDRNATKV